MVEEQASSTVGRIVFRRRTYGLPRQDVWSSATGRDGFYVYTSRPPRIYVPASMYIRLVPPVQSLREVSIVSSRSNYTSCAKRL